MTLEELNDWCALWRAPGVGPTLFQRIIQGCGSPSAFFDGSTATVRAALPEISERHWQKWRLQRGAGAQDLEWCAQAEDRAIISCSDARYPPQLLEIPEAPPLLFVCGDPAVLLRPQLAIVGSRNAGLYGIKQAKYFAATLAEAGLVITSGLALGIDGIAAEAALDAGGQSVAVVGTGVDRVYPARHRDLAHRITAQGAMVSEYPIGVGVRAHHFPRRNRIITGLALGTLVVSAARQSGSLSSARWTLEQGREVFAVPGSIDDPLSAGCHDLIRDGATLCAGVEDIVQALHQLSLTHAPKTPRAEVLPENTEARALLLAIAFDGTSLDELCASSKLTYSEISAMLFDLELDGYVGRMPDGRYQRLS